MKVHSLPTNFVYAFDVKLFSPFIIRFSALKQRIFEAESADEAGRYLVSLSLSACRVAIANGNSISFYQAGKVILGLKGIQNHIDTHVCTLCSCGALSFEKGCSCIVITYVYLRTFRLKHARGFSV